MSNISPYTPASWNTGLYLNSLQRDIIAIGTAIGYYYNLIPVNGAVITNNNTTVTLLIHKVMADIQIALQ